MRRISAWAAALGLMYGCGSGEDGAPATGDTEQTSGTQGEPMSGDPSAADSDSTAGSSGDDPPGVLCPEPEPQQTVDALDHRSRAEGGTFIEILDLEARGDLVYGCTATQGLTVWDVATDFGDLISQRIGPDDLANPEFPRCQHVALDAAGRRAVITNRGDEVQPQPWLFVYDVEDPSQPIPLRGWSGEASIEGATFGGDRIYAAAHTAGIMVFEDAGGESLVQVGSLADEDSDAWLPVLDRNVLYVAEGASGVRVYDVSGDDPSLLATVPLPGSSRDLALDGDTLFVAASSAVVALDVSDPSAPSVIVQTDTAGTAVALGMGADGLVYTAEWDEVRAYDPALPDMPRVWSEVVPTSDDFSRVLSVATHPERSRVYAGEWTGMHIFESRPGGTGPDIVASPSSVQFGRVEPGDAEDRVVVVRNEGDQPLHVWGAESDWDAVSIDDACFTVEPGASHAAELHFEPDSTDARASTMRLRTNDPDEAEYTIRFAGNSSGADIGDPMPDFMLQDLEGNDWRREDLEGHVVLLAYFATF